MTINIKNNNNSNSSSCGICKFVRPPSVTATTLIPAMSFNLTRGLQRKNSICHNRAMMP